MGTKEEYINLYNNMIELVRKLNEDINMINQIKILSKRAIVVNDTISFCENFDLLREKMVKKRNTIVNSILPLIKVEIMKR